MRFLILVALLIVGSVTACQWDNKRPSFLIIAIDSLPFDTIQCNEIEKLRGFKDVCEGMIRFTHAYTPSIMSQSAVASLLTGKYPFEHGVWNNGSSFLSAKFKTSAEVAYEQDYRTAFISGGPPIWRKSGFEQGFEFFDDNIFVDVGKYYRPVFENLRVLQNWLSGIGRDNFFSFIYLPDLQFPEVPTVDNDGYPREATYTGQLQEIDESLESFFEYLKKNGKWNNTWIIVTGLNGISRESRLDDFQGTNLYHENTNVALFIKPPQKEHQVFNWTIDFNMNLVDIGRTLYDLLDAKFYDTTMTLFQTVSLKPSLLSSEDIDIDRVLLFESGWPQWRRYGRTLFALQKDNYFMLYEKPPRLFNTFIDRNQIYPIDIQQASMQILTRTASQLISLLNFEEGQKISKDISDKYIFAKSFFGKTRLREDPVTSLERLYAKTKDIEVAGWLARFYLENKNWQSLLKLGTNAHQMDWVWVASQNLDLVSPEPSSCLRLLTDGPPDISNYYSVCNDSMVIQFLGWVKNRNSAEAASYRESFFKLYRFFKMDLDIQKLNMQNGYIWDTGKDKAAKPHDIELLLGLNRMSRYKVLIDKRF